MEKKKLTNRYLTFLTGTIFGGLLFGVFLLISGSKPPDSPAQPNSSPGISARIYYHKYLSNKPLSIDTLKAIAIDQNQLIAMNSIHKNPKYIGYRIYSGLDNGANKISIVVGFDNLNHDDTTSILITSRTYDPCPPICDKTSPIN